MCTRGFFSKAIKSEAASFQVVDNAVQDECDSRLRRCAGPYYKAVSLARTIPTNNKTFPLHRHLLSAHCSSSLRLQQQHRAFRECQFHGCSLVDVLHISISCLLFDFHQGFPFQHSSFTVGEKRPKRAQKRVSMMNTPAYNAILYIYHP